MFTPIPGMPKSVIAMDAVGTISDTDYKDILVPSIEKALQAPAGIRLLIRFGPEFQGYSAKAVLDDAMLGIKHLHDFERLAVVTDVGWIQNGFRLFSPVMPGQSRVFATADMDSAVNWIAE